MFVDDREDLLGNFLPFAQEFVEGGFTSDSTHGGLSELEHGVVDVLDLVDGHGRVADFVVDDGVDFAANVVFGDSILFGDVNRLGTDINLAERLKDRDDQFPPRVNDIAEFTHGIDYATLVFVDLFERDEDKKNNDWE